MGSIGVDKLQACGSKRCGNTPAFHHVMFVTLVGVALLIHDVIVGELLTELLLHLKVLNVALLLRLVFLHHVVELVGDNPVSFQT